ncbi:hypothetical protein HPB49_010488 [Dermacentor silvarum]|uniref:Uncharacterized protein n=1 Tax=Dermacentor silvarum TaxID=543639 RepID=A0ACB8CEN6_DERSI|nr:hypothetical protein HPB49_010488 [Dermacentor silvarum]
MAGQQARMWGYDPDAMIRTTVSTHDKGEPAPSSTIKSTDLAAAVVRRTWDRLLRAAVVDAASPGAPATGVCHDKTPPHASRAAGNKGKHYVAWKPLTLPKPAPDDFVVVVKPKTWVSLREVFQEHGLGRAYIAYLGPASAQVITVLPDDGNVCYGVVTVRNTDTEETLRSSLQWRQGEILGIRKFWTSKKSRLTFSGKDKPKYVHYEAMLIQVR